MKIHSKFWREEYSEIADSKVSIHDRHRFEIKLDIELPPAKKSSYKISSYFFIPKSLNISSHSYPKEKFYSCSQQYIRFKTPQISLKKILDLNVAFSPLHKIRKKWPLLLENPSDTEISAKIFKEIKLFGAILRRAIRDYIRYLLHEISLMKDKNNDQNSENRGSIINREALFDEMAHEFLNDIINLITVVDGLKNDFLNPHFPVPLKLKDAILFLDEFTSLTIEDFLILFLDQLREDGFQKNFSSLEKSLVSIIKKQSEHRRSMGYRSLVKKGIPNVEFPYRRGVLKKFMASALFLNIEPSDWEGTLQFTFALAAGVAMFFASLMMIFAQNHFAPNSGAFISIIVVSYMFKDRLKDWLKMMFTKSMTQWIADRKVKIRDPYTNKIVGHLKEAFTFVDYDLVPEEVLQKRNRDNLSSIDEDGNPERVIKHEKEVVIYADNIFRFHERMRNVNDIMRMNIDDFLRQTDDVLIDHLYLNPENHELEHLQCERVYHINMVIKYGPADEQNRPKSRLDRFRLVLNRDGIRSLEEII